MGFYVAKMHDFEILQMKCDFAKDDNGTIWFQYASQIKYRDTPGRREAQEAAR